MEGFSATQRILVTMSLHCYTMIAGLRTLHSSDIPTRVLESVAFAVQKSALSQKTRLRAGRRVALLTLYCMRFSSESGFDFLAM